MHSSIPILFWSFFDRDELVLELSELRFRRSLAHVAFVSMLPLDLVHSLLVAFVCCIQCHVETWLTCFLVHTIHDAQPASAREWCNAYISLAFRNVFPVELPVTCTGDVQVTALPSTDIHWCFLLRCHVGNACFVRPGILAMFSACCTQQHADTCFDTFAVRCFRMSYPMACRGIADMFSGAFNP